MLNEESSNGDIKLGRRSLFYNACKEAYRMGYVAPSAKKILKKLQKLLAIPADEAKTLAEQAKKSAARSPAGTTLDEEGLFTIACRLAWADRILEPREQKILSGLADAFEIDRKTAKTILTDMKQEAIQRLADREGDGTVDP